MGGLYLFVLQGFVRTSYIKLSLVPRFICLFKNLTLGLSESKSLMKKLILTALTLLSISIYSQSATKKYNDYYKRYEYFDSRGNMTGYETYNSYHYCPIKEAYLKASKIKS